MDTPIQIYITHAWCSEIDVGYLKMRFDDCCWTTIRYDTIRDERGMESNVQCESK